MSPYSPRPTARSPPFLPFNTPTAPSVFGRSPRSASPAGRDLELWILPQGAKAPISFGVLPAGGKRFTPAQVPPPQAQLLVSLEQPGGSPTGKPQGPILYGGTLTALN